MNSASLLWTGEGFVPNATLPVTDRGVRYGMSLFETVRVRNHRAERVVTHLHSLRAACALAGFPDPAAALSEAWAQLASEVLPALIPPAMAGGGIRDRPDLRHCGRWRTRRSGNRTPALSAL